MKKIIALLLILFLLSSPVIAEESGFSVKEITGNRQNIHVSFSENVTNAEIMLYETDNFRISNIPSVSYYNSSDNTLTVAPCEALDLKKTYEIRVTYGENLENKYIAYFRYDILNETPTANITANEHNIVFKLNEEKEIYNKYRNYTVEFDYPKDFNTSENNLSVSFYSDKTYNVNWNYHNTVGITLSQDKSLWTFWDTKDFSSDEISAESIVEQEGSIFDIHNNDVKVSASVLGKKLSYFVSDDKNVLYSLSAQADITDESIKNNFGTFSVMSQKDTEITNVVCYKLSSYENESGEIKIHTIDFEKNADTIAKADKTETITVKDADGNAILNDDGSEKMINAAYAEIDTKTWFNGLSVNKFGMYFSGLKSKFFPVDGIMSFKRVYREDTVDENGEITGSKYVSSSTETFVVETDASGYNSKVNDAFLLCNSENESFHAPTLEATLKNVPTSSVRFAAQTNSSSITVSILYTDGYSEEHEILTGQHGNITYVSYWKDFYKYFKTYDEEVTAGIIGEYTSGTGNALYPYNYITTHDCASVDIENTASSDIRYSYEGIRYYVPRLFLFEVKTDSLRIPEKITLSVSNSNPTVIYSIMQCEKTDKNFICRDYDIKETEVSLMLNTENISFSSYIPIFAVYDKDDVLFGVSSEVNGNNIIINNIDTEQISYGKLFLWNENENMAPLCEAVILK